MDIKINYSDVKIPSFVGTKILVVGDVMLDCYITGDTQRMSPEAPVPIVHTQTEQKRLGGAANVAYNTATLGCETMLIGIVGDDNHAQDVNQLLKSYNIKCDLHQTTQAPTICKTRVMSRNQQLLRMDEETHFSAKTSESLYAKFEQHLPQCNMVILSDYAKGTISDPSEFIKLAKRYKKPILIDPKGKDFLKYKGATMLTPNIKEFMLACGSIENETALIKQAYIQIKKLKLAAMLITRGSDGMTLLQADKSVDHIPANKVEVFDITGAGDTAIATLAAMLAAKQPLLAAVKCANLAASVAVSKIGTVSVNVNELIRALSQRGVTTPPIMSLPLLLDALINVRQQNKRIVFTNGCFDILHAGHIELLSQAKQLGDCLIVALNDDDSVQRFKGPDRPITTLENRAAIINALSMVDFVISFSDDTPQRLIEQIVPDVLIKGEDYSKENIVGAKFVLDHGGEVKVLKHLPDNSTSNIIHKIQNPN